MQLVDYVIRFVCIVTCLMTSLCIEQAVTACNFVAFLLDAMELQSVQHVQSFCCQSLLAGPPHRLYNQHLHIVQIRCIQLKHALGLVSPYS